MFRKGAFPEHQFEDTKLAKFMLNFGFCSSSCPFHYIGFVERCSVRQNTSLETAEITGPEKGESNVPMVTLFKRQLCFMYFSYPYIVFVLLTILFSVK